MEQYTSSKIHLRKAGQDAACDTLDLQDDVLSDEMEEVTCTACSRQSLEDVFIAEKNAGLKSH